MKFFIAVLAVCFVGALALTNEQKAKLKEHKDICLAQTGVNPALVEKVKHGEIADDPKLACFASCMMQRIGVINAAGVVNEQVARAKLPSTVPVDKAEDIIKACKNLKGSSYCDNALQIFKCYLQHGKFNILA